MIQRFFCIFGLLTAIAAVRAEPKIVDYSDLPVLYQKSFTLIANPKGTDIEILLETFQGYSVYKDTFSVSSPNYTFNLKEETPPLKSVDPITQKLKDFYKGQNAFIYSYQSTEHKFPSELTIKLQACSKTNCLLPVAVRIQIGEPSSLVPPKRPASNEPKSILSITSLLILFFCRTSNRFLALCTSNVPNYTRNFFEVVASQRP